MSGFDPSHGPVRAHDFILRVGADTLADLAWSLRHLADDFLRHGPSTHCCSGSPSAGYLYSYRADPNMTHDRYFREIDEWLARDSGSGSQSENPEHSGGVEAEGPQSGPNADSGIAHPLIPPNSRPST